MKGSAATAVLGNRKRPDKPVSRCPACDGAEYFPCRPDEDSPRLIMRCVDCRHESPMPDGKTIGPPKEKALNSNHLLVNGILGLDKLPLEPPGQPTPAPRNPRPLELETRRKPRPDITQQVITDSPVNKIEPELQASVPQNEELPKDEIIKPIEEEPMEATAAPGRSPREAHDYTEANTTAILEDAKTIGATATARKHGVSMNTVYDLCRNNKVKPATPGREKQGKKKLVSTADDGAQTSDYPYNIMRANRDGLLQRVAELEAEVETKRQHFLTQAKDWREKYDTVCNQRDELQQSISQAAETCARLTAAHDTEKARADKAESSSKFWESQINHADHLVKESTERVSGLEGAIKRQSEKIQQLESNPKFPSFHEVGPLAQVAWLNVWAAVAGGAK